MSDSPLDPDTGIVDAARREERAVVALEWFASALTRIATVMENRYHRDFPSKPAARDAIITRVPSPEDKLKEDLGSTGESEEEWIGLREQELLNQSGQDSKRTAETPKK
jgi:hypothetical protein